MKSYQCALSPEGGSLSPEAGLLSHRGDFLSQKIGAILKSEIVQTTPVNSMAPYHFRGKKLKPHCL